MTEDQWDDVVYVHLRGTFLNTQAAVRYMVESGTRGRIINIVSGVGIYGNIGQSNYSAAKGGIASMAKTHSKELVLYGICVNAIAPWPRQICLKT
jgi:3-oxoacyl-[acyl-carrier protein] reductase